MAFACHDTTGQGVLDCFQFEAFLSSLNLGLSRDELAHLAASLVGPGGPGVALGTFSDAITNAQPLDRRFGESWALAMLNALAGNAQGGLARFAGRPDQEVLAGVPVLDADELVPEQVVALLLPWLPKTPEGAVDWVAAEEFRACGLGPSSQGK